MLNIHEWMRIVRNQQSAYPLAGYPFQEEWVNRVRAGRPLAVLPDSICQGANRLDASMRYFSDFHNNGHVSIDGNGSELFGIDAAKDEAITALVEIMPYALRSGDKRELAISVRDEDGTPVLKVVVIFEVIVPH
jgi:hypothetical protein